MRTLPYLLALVGALALSGQLLLMTKRGCPIGKRLRDVETGGDAFTLLIVGVLTLGAAGAVLGSLVRFPAIGAAVGSAVTLTSWTVAVAHAHRHPHPPARHR